ncbi:MAG: HAD family hydrolase, partial [Acidimicrobiales bacterium]
MPTLGLPPQVTACLFDLDGVLTRTASIHAAAWKQMFDEFLRGRSARTGQEFEPFDAGDDYDAYVDGKQRLDGTRGFLRSRGIDLPEGSQSDPAGAPTVNGLSNRKNELVLRLFDEGQIEVFDGSVRYVRAVRAAGLATAVVSSSANTAQVLEAAGIAGLFDARIDGVVAAERHLAGKPAPDTFLAGAAALGA